MRAADVFTPSRILRFGVLVLVAAVLLGAVGVIISRAGENHATAYFDRTVGIYEGSDVRILGVKVGEVETITPRGEVGRGGRACAR